MSNRLSNDALVEAYESGLSGLQWQQQDESPGAIANSRNVTAAAKIDFNALLSAEEPREAIQALEPALVYRALVEQGPEDLLDVLDHLSQEQWVTIIDYEGWDEDHLTLAGAGHWLDLYRNISQEALFERFKSLEEEVQIGLLGPYVDVIEEETYEKLGTVDQDLYQQLPCRTLWYRYRTTDPVLTSTLESIVEAGLSCSVEYTYSLLAHACYMPPNESEFQALRFRNARLEDDGFVSYEESLRVFAPDTAYADLSRQYLQKGEELRGVVKTRNPRALFLDDCLRVLGDESSSTYSDQEPGKGSDVRKAHLRLALTHLANSLCAATKLEPDKTAGIRLLLQHCQALISLSLEILSQANPEKGAQILLEQHPTKLFKFAIGVVDSLRADVITALKLRQFSPSERIESLWKLRHHGALMQFLDTDCLDSFGFEGNEVMKGLFNRFPLCPAVIDMPAEAGKVDRTGQRIAFRTVSAVADVQLLREQVNAIIEELNVPSRSLH